MQYKTMKPERPPKTKTEAEIAMEEVKKLYTIVKELPEGSSEYDEAFKKHGAAMARYKEIKNRDKPKRTILAPELPQPEKRIYTLADLKAEEEWDSGMGPNNPGAFAREMKLHRRRLREVRQSLIEQGLLEKTDQEKINEKLDKLHPFAKSRTIVEHEKKRYQIHYYPLETSNTGKTVWEWGHEWVLLDK